MDNFSHEEFEDEHKSSSDMDIDDIEEETDSENDDMTYRRALKICKLLKKDDPNSFEGLLNEEEAEDDGAMEEIQKNYMVNLQQQTQPGYFIERWMSERLNLQQEQQVDPNMGNIQVETNIQTSQTQPNQPTQPTLPTQPEKQQPEKDATKNKTPTRSKSKKRKKLPPDIDDDTLAAIEHEIFPEFEPRRKRRKRGRRKRGLPEEIANLIGEANAQFIVKNYEKAIQLLMEVVRLKPSLPDPYHTLGVIYDDMGDKQKALQFYLLAALFTKRDVDLWRRVLDMSILQQKPQQAIYCLTRILRIQPTNYNALFERSVLFIQMNMPKRAIEGFQKLTKVFPQDVDVVVQLAKLHHQCNEIDEAIKVLENSVDYNPSQADPTIVNMLAELYMNKGQFKSSNQLIEKYMRQTNVKFEELYVELRIKYGISQAYLGDLEYAEKILEPILKNEDWTVYGDLIYDVAETYNTIGEYDRALPLYERLMNFEDFNKPGIWFKVGECYQKTGLTDKAIEYFERVIDVVPDSVEARIALSELYREIGQMEKALDILEFESRMEEEDEEEMHTISEKEKADIRVIAKKAWLFYSQEKYKEYLDTVLPVLNEIVDAALETKPRKKRGLKSKSKKELPENVLTWEEAEMALGEEELFNLLITACKVLSLFEDYKRSGELCHKIIKCGKITDPDKVKQLRYLSVGIAFNSEDYISAYNDVRYVLNERPSSIPILNLFNKIITKAGNFATNQKFMTRLLHKHNESAPLMVLVGHNSSMSGSYRLALGLYLEAYRQMPDEPLISLCIGLGYLNLVMNRRSANRHLLVVQAFTFLYNYYALKKGDQESCFNLARAFHQLGIFHLAVEYYERVLRMSAKIENYNKRLPENEKISENLKREAAYNLHLIYKDSGNHALAMKILSEYLTI